MTPEQERALALARARKRRAESQAPHAGSPWPQAADDPQPGSGGYGSQIFSGLLEGATGALGFPIDAVNNLVVRPAVSGVNALFGTNLSADNPLGGSAGLRQGLAIAPPSDEVGPQMARRVSQSVGGALVPLAGTARTAGQAASGIGTALGGGLVGATAQQLFPGNVGAEIAGELIGGLGTGAAISGLANRAARRAAERAVPSIDELKAQAGDLYRSAEARGVVAGPVETQKLADDIADIARQNELVTPTGRVSTAYPKAKEALDLMSDYSGHQMNPTQMQVIRETLSDAANTTQGKESRIAKQMLKAFDDFSTPLAPELGRARDVSQRYIKAQQLETMRELAEANRSRFGASGVENALRQEYRNLDRRIVRGQEGGWSPEQVEAIQRVNRGTAGSNAAQKLGKLAPTGVVSFGLGGGFPFMVGNAIGGPGVGAAFSGLTMGAGFLGREAATLMGIRNAEIAELLARGGSLSGVTNSEVSRRVIEALIGSQAATQAP